MLPFITPLIFVHTEQRSRSKLTHQSLWTDLCWRSLNCPQLSSFRPSVRNCIPSVSTRRSQRACPPGWCLASLGFAKLPPTSFLWQQIQRLVSLKFVSRSGAEENGGREPAYQNALPKQKWFLRHMVLPRERWWQPPPISGTVPRVVCRRIHMTHSYTQFHSVLCLLLVHILGTMDLYIFVSEFDSQLVV